MLVERLLETGVRVLGLHLNQVKDWLANRMGTRTLWQSTNRTTGHGTKQPGRGSARRLCEFRLGSETFRASSRRVAKLGAWQFNGWTT